MKNKFLLLGFLFFNVVCVNAQRITSFRIPKVADSASRIAIIEEQWKAMHQTPPNISVRDCFLFLMDALDTRHFSDADILWTLQKIRTRVIDDPAAPSFGNMYWGWDETGGDVGDGNNVEFCVQYGILIKELFNDRLSTDSRKLLDEIFQININGIKNPVIRVSYTNMYMMKIWNLLELGQIYQRHDLVELSRKHFNIWLDHVSKYGNREYDSPTYCGVDMESLLFMYQFSRDADIKKKAGDAINLFLTDICAHYNQRSGNLEGAHSRDYNRVFGKDLLEEKYFNPFLTNAKGNNQLFTQICLTIFKSHGLNDLQKSLLSQEQKFIRQRWDSMSHTYAFDYHGKKFSIASSNQYYSPDDKSFVAYLSSKRMPTIPNIVYVAEGRDDHYGTWAANGMGDKMKHLMPPNYPVNGGWGKARHLMPFMQTAQNKNEFVMLVSGEKDHNCIKDQLNSTIILPDYFDQIYFGNTKVAVPSVGSQLALDATNTFFGKFEDVVVAIRFLWSNATGSPVMYNDGYGFTSHRENFSLKNNKAIRITLQHPSDGKLNVSMWWKIVEGIDTEAKFQHFRNLILTAPVAVSVENNIVDVAVHTATGKLGLKADLKTKTRLGYYGVPELPKNLLFEVNGKELGKPIMEKYSIKEK